MTSDLLRARYATFAALSVLFSIYLMTALPWQALFSVLLALAISALLTAALEFWVRLLLRRAALRQQALPQPAGLFFQFQKTILGVTSERELLESALEAGLASLNAGGASFVPYDEYGQSLPTVILGKVPESALEDWSRRLSSPATRQACKECRALPGLRRCVLIPDESGAPTEVRCFPLHSAGRTVGVVNYFFEQPACVDAEKQGLMASLHDFAGQALEALRLRSQEMAALRYLQAATGPKSQLSALFENLLETVQKALDADFALLYIPGGARDGIAASPMLLVHSRANAAPLERPEMTFLEGLWKTIQSSRQSISLENVSLNQRGVWKLLLAVPLEWRNSGPVGILLLGSNNAQIFAQRQRALIETIAVQLALLLQNARLMAQLEYQAVLDERARLAREIHDGLAQTLAFLKIQSAQMQNYLSRGETERLTLALQSSYRTLSDAYLDARQAIENLRRAPSSSLRDWLGHVLEDFHQSSGIPAELLFFEVSGSLPLTAQAQLIRIVQEALSNVRKHAAASQVLVSVCEQQGDIVLEVRDNGVGFLPEHLKGGARYGLRGMRERADALGAEFQISSQPGQGAVVSLRLPARLKEEM